MSTPSTIDDATPTATLPLIRRNVLAKKFPTAGDLRRAFKTRPLDVICTLNVGRKSFKCAYDFLGPRRQQSE